METYRVQARRTMTEFGYVFIEADSPDEARREAEQNASAGAIGAFEPEELIEEQYDFEGTEEPEAL